MRISTVVRAIALVGVLVASPLFAQTVPERTPIAGAWGPNGPVSDTAIVGDTVFLGGAFDYVGPPSGPFGTVDTIDGQSAVPYVSTDAETLSATPDGAGGWFLVLRVKEFGLRFDVRHVLADGTTDPAFASHVFAYPPQGVIVGGGRLYVYGGFLAIDGIPRVGLAALDPTTGALLPWNAQLDSSVQTAAVDGGRLFVAGYFQTIGGQVRDGMAALDADTGALLPVTFSDTKGASVFSLAAAGGRVYAQGGCFPTPTTFRAVCAYQADGSVLPNWGGTSNEFLGPLVATPTRVYIAGGQFVLGVDEYRVRGYAPVTGAADGWQSGRLGQGSSSGYISAMTVAGSRLFTSGSFASINGTPRRRFAAFDISTAALTPWEPAVSAAAAALVSDGSRLGIVGRFRSIGGVYVSSLTALDLRTGRPKPLPLPSMPGPVGALAASGSLVVAGAGDSIVAFSATTGTELTRFTVSAPGAPPGTAMALAIAEPTLFVGGNFVDLRGQPRKHLGAIDMRTGQATSFDPRPDGQVYRLRVSSGAVYAVGAFRTVPGYSRAGVAAWDAASGILETFSPPDIAAQDVAFYKDRVLVAGYANPLSTAGTVWTGRVAGEALALGRPVPYVARAAARLGDTMFVGGYPSPGWPNAGLSAIDAGSGALLPWAPEVGGTLLPYVDRVDASTTATIVTGNFLSVDGSPAYNLAIFPMARAAAPRQMTAAVSGNTLTLGWQPGSGPAASGYVVEVGTTSGGAEVGAFPVGALTRVTGTLPAGTFYARVRGTSAQGTGAPGSEVVVTTPSVSLPPQAPSGLSATVANGVVTLSWTAAAGNATTYVVEAGTGPGLSNIGALPLGHLDTSFNTSAPSGTYVIRVRAANAFGTGPASNEVTVVVP